MTQDTEPQAAGAPLEEDFGYVPLPDRGPAIILGSLAVATFVALTVVYRVEIGRALEPSPEPFAHAEHHAPMREWMVEHFPAFVVEANNGDADRAETATATLVAASGFHQGLALRGADLGARLVEFKRFSESNAIQTRERAQDGFDEVLLALRRLERMLRHIGAPFSVDHDVKARRNGKGDGWDVRFVARTSEVLGISRFAASDGVSLSVMRIRRLDRLNILDLIHGQAVDGYAMVLVDGVMRAVINRYLPVLAPRPQLRDIFADDDEQKASAAALFLRPQLKQLLPAGLREHASDIGQLAHERRAAYEAAADVLGRYGRNLKPPPTVILSDEELERWEQRLGKKRHPAVLAKLRRFSARSDLPAERLDRLKEAALGLQEHYVRSVELHEAWHLLAGRPKVISDDPMARSLARGASSEAVAYLGGIADAGPELPLVVDKTLNLFRARVGDERDTRTNVALRAVGPALLRAAIAGRADPPQGMGLLEAVSWRGRNRLEVQRARARELMKDWLGEERTLAFVDHVPGAAAMAP